MDGKEKEDTSHALSNEDLLRECESARLSAKDALRKNYALNQILGKTKAVNELREKIKRISDCDVTVLITGESGTGKELAARAVHYHGCYVSF